MEITEKISQEVSTLLRSGTTLLIPLINWRKLGVDNQLTFLDWLMTTFWQRILRSVDQEMEEYSPRVFFVILVGNELSEDCQQSDYFGDETNMDCDKIVRLPLTCWCQADVKRWLRHYSPKLKKSERKALVEYIFDGKAEDEPIKVRKALEDAYAESSF